MKLFALAFSALVSLSAHAQVRALPIEDNAFLQHCRSHNAIVRENHGMGTTLGMGIEFRGVPSELQWEASYTTVARLIDFALSRGSASEERHIRTRDGVVSCERVFELLNQSAVMDLSNEEITDVTPISGLSRLRTLVLRSPVTDGRRLSAAETVTDISSLSALQNLEYIDLTGQNVSDISALGELPRLRYAVLRNMPLRRSLPLARAAALRRVDFSGTPVTDFVALQSARRDLRIELGRR